MNGYCINYVRCRTRRSKTGVRNRSYGAGERTKLTVLVMLPGTTSTWLVGTTTICLICIGRIIEDTSFVISVSYKSFS